MHTEHRLQQTVISYSTALGHMRTASCKFEFTKLMLKRDLTTIFFIHKSSEEGYSVIKHFRDYSPKAVMGNSLSAGGIQFLFPLPFLYQASGKETDATHVGRISKAEIHPKIHGQEKRHLIHCKFSSYITKNWRRRRRLQHCPVPKSLTSGEGLSEANLYPQLGPAGYRVREEATIPRAPWNSSDSFPLAAVCDIIILFV